MRHGMNGLALPVQEGLQRDPHAGDPMFRGRRSDSLKVLWHNGLVRIPSNQLRPRCDGPAPASWRLIAICSQDADMASADPLLV
jgi:hypothetical protein